MIFEHLHMKPIPFPGYPAPFWLRYLGLIEEIIKEFKLQAIPEKQMKALTLPIKFDPGTHGGNRGPHLHLGENIYILNDKQWKAFSDKLSAEFQSKLKGANSIPVQDMMVLDDTISGIPVRL